ncbi:MAG: hypothetical protein WBF78_13600, partial [Vibrio anguillarum]
MKKGTFTMIGLLLCIGLYGQLSIGKATPVAGAILDFETPTTKGLVLPHVQTPDASSVAGTLIFNTISKKVEVKVGTSWQDLSINQGTFTQTGGYATLSDNGKGLV